MAQRVRGKISTTYEADEPGGLREHYGALLLQQRSQPEDTQEFSWRWEIPRHIYLEAHAA